MDKLKMAHEWAMVCLKSGLTAPMEELIIEAWKYANAMQAEADKRNNKELPDVLLTKDKDGNCLHFHHEFGHKKCMDCGSSLEEWQPDWSEAPINADYWAMDKSSLCNWYENKPEICDDQWDFGDAIEVAPQFTYTGPWQDSLRKRPSNI